MSAQLTRRSFLAACGAASAAIVVTPTIANAADDTTPSFALDPTGGGTGCTTGCAACNACRHHAANKLFQNNKAADKQRAHPGCRCTIVAGQPLTPTVAAALFTDIDSVDRRDPKTAKLLGTLVEAHSVPMLTGPLPITILVASTTASVLWLAHRRNERTAQPPIL